MIPVKLIINYEPYANDNAIENTIRYIYRLDNPYKFYYGIYPPSPENAITLFYQIKKMLPQNTCDQQVQHVIISFGDFQDIKTINNFTNQIACLFSNYYPVCLALHDDEKYLHTHFIISTASYIPGVTPLTRAVLNTIIPMIEQIAASYDFSLRKVTKNV